MPPVFPARLFNIKGMGFEQKGYSVKPLPLREKQTLGSGRAFRHVPSTKPENPRTLVLGSVKYLTPRLKLKRKNPGAKEDRLIRIEEHTSLMIPLQLILIGAVLFT